MPSKPHIGAGTQEGVRHDGGVEVVVALPDTGQLAGGGQQDGEDRRPVHGYAADRGTGSLQPGHSVSPSFPTMASAISSSTTSDVTNLPRRAPRTAAAFSIPAATPMRKGIPARASADRPTRRLVQRCRGDASLGIDVQAADRAHGTLVHQCLRFLRRQGAASHQRADGGDVRPDAEEGDPRLGPVPQRLGDPRLAHQHVPQLDALHHEGGLDDPVAARQQRGQLLRQPETVDLGVSRAQARRGAGPPRHP